VVGATIITGGAEYTYPLYYGFGQCTDHDATLPPDCANDDGEPLSNAPDWCASEWCFVDPDTCTGTEVTASSYFSREGEDDVFFYSYDTCGDGNTFVLFEWKNEKTELGYDEKACADASVPCTTITWGDEEVDAFCGTATMEDDEDWKVLGCFPTADCETLGGTLPGFDDEYILECGSMRLLASAVVAIVAAFSM